MKSWIQVIVLPVPIKNISCYNEEVWENLAERPVSVSEVVKTTILASMALVTVLVNMLFVLVLRSSKYLRHTQVQVTFDLKFLLFPPRFSAKEMIAICYIFPFSSYFLGWWFCKGS